MKNIIDRADLACKSGSKDAVYHLQIVEVEGGFVVNYQNGRAGGTLASGSKSPKGPGTLELARKTFDKVVKEKMTASPPYQPMPGEGSQFTQLSAEMKERLTGLLPQLLNDLPATMNLEELMRDPNFVVQQKFDGERRLLKQESITGQAIGSNRRGLEVPIPLEIAASIRGVVCTLDGEIIGTHFHAFDLLELDGKDLRGLAYGMRKDQLNGIAPHFGRHITVVKDALTMPQKLALWRGARRLKQEGIVLKDLNAPYTQGRPNSFGTQYKVKNWNDATVEVMGITPDRRSVMVGVRNPDSCQPEALIEVGAVTIATNQAIPAVADLIDVKYLYAFEGGSMFQPTFKGVRTDLEPIAANLTQLVFKAANLDVARQLLISQNELNPWAVVRNPGQADEEIYAGFFDEADARRCMRHNPGTDVMKHLGNGVLTTEF
jgi:bifunctional non-homologous end joining protein LigD